MPKTTHRMWGTPTYKSWQSMRQRCDNPKSTSFKYYGALGISYPARWIEFEQFLEDMGVRPEGMSLDRINPELHYSKANCKWSTAKEQANNRGNNIFVMWEGALQTPEQMMQIWEVKRSTFDTRMRKFFRKTGTVYEQQRRLVVRK